MCGAQSLCVYLSACAGNLHVFVCMCPCVHPIVSVSGVWVYLFVCVRAFVCLFVAASESVYACVCCLSSLEHEVLPQDYTECAAEAK